MDVRVRPLRSQVERIRLEFKNVGLSGAGVLDQMSEDEEKVVPLVARHGGETMDVRLRPLRSQVKRIRLAVGPVTASLPPYFEAVGRVTASLPPYFEAVGPVTASLPPYFEAVGRVTVAYPPILRPWAGLQ